MNSRRKPVGTTTLTTTLTTALALALMALPACSSSRTSAPASTGTGSSVPATSTPDTTDTTAVTTPDTATPTTPASAADMMELRQDGIGSTFLGDPAADVIAALTAALGAPVTDESADYPNPDGAGNFLDSFDEVQFVAQRGRTVCFGNSLCLFFGGPDAATLSFAGWSYTDDPAAAMHTLSGVTIGSRWADFASMEVYEGGCYTVGSGVADGVRLWVQSSGTQFSEVDTLGNWVNNLPDPADVTVMSLESGDMPLFLAGDC